MAAAIWVLDLDGVVWLAGAVVPGAPEAVGAIRARGDRILFATNNSSATVSAYVEALASIGIGADAADVVTSAQAAASLIEPGSRALVCGGDGVREALAARGVGVVDAGGTDAVAVDTVVVGWHREFDYAGLTAAMTAVRAGARLVATNDDATYPTPAGPLPGGGALVAAVAYASDALAVVAGKPHPPMADLVRARIGSAPVRVVVGDRPSTDGLLARRLGCPFALVLSGVTPALDPVAQPAPDVVGADLGDVVAALLDQGDAGGLGAVQRS